MSANKTVNSAPGAIDGDPGVGGLLADPLAAPDPAAKVEKPDNPPSPEPAPPIHHGDWTPTRDTSHPDRPSTDTAADS
jgi:hypothetical protein